MGGKFRTIRAFDRKHAEKDVSEETSACLFSPTDFFFVLHSQETKMKREDEVETWVRTTNPLANLDKLRSLSWWDFFFRSRISSHLLEQKTSNLSCYLIKQVRQILVSFNMKSFVLLCTWNAFTRVSIREGEFQCFFLQLLLNDECFGYDELLTVQSEGKSEITGESQS